MVNILVETECGAVSEHYDFQSTPRVGDIIFVATKSKKEIKIRVKLVEHYPIGKHTNYEPPGNITLQCERLGD